MEENYEAQDWKYRKRALVQEHEKAHLQHIYYVEQGARHQDKTGSWGL